MKYPNGKINDTDQGELRIAIYKEKGEIILNFGKDLSWIGFGKVEALALAKLLIQKANENDSD